MDKETIRTAIIKSGGCSEVARRLGVSRQAVMKWTYTRVPADHVWRLAKMSGMNPESLRPDVFQD